MDRFFYQLAEVCTVPDEEEWARTNKKVWCIFDRSYSSTHQIAAASDRGFAQMIVDSLNKHPKDNFKDRRFF